MNALKVRKLTKKEVADTEWEQEPLPTLEDTLPPVIECTLSKSGNHQRIQILNEQPWCTFCGAKLPN